ncbi:MAG TPA: hypothetical protein VE981_02020 [Planctomycetota bacterium]|nr:hypothetical protein [Planctomycetota bacterium]
MDGLVHGSARGKAAFWPGLFIYLVGAGGAAAGVFLSTDMNGLPFLIFGSVGLLIYSSLALLLAFQFRSDPEGVPVKKLPRRMGPRGPDASP